MRLIKRSFSIACAVVIAGCGGGDDSGGSDTNVVVSTGVFLDSAVEGLGFTTATQSGVTNAEGEFQYITGEEVSFTVGAISLPSASAQATVTPLTLFDTSDVTDTRVSNLARLLQSLDADSDATNGITFASALQSASTGLTLDFSDSDFANNTDVINLVAGSGSTTTTLIDAATAEAHLQSTLETLTSGGAAGVEILIAGSPWYSIFEKTNSECGIKYTFSADGGASVVFQEFGTEGFQTASGTFSLSDTNVLETQFDVFGYGSFPLAFLTSVEWGGDRTNNSGEAYVDHAFSSRDAALQRASELGIDCGNGWGGL